LYKNLPQLFFELFFYINLTNIEAFKMENNITEDQDLAQTEDQNESEEETNLASIELPIDPSQEVESGGFAELLKEYFKDEKKEGTIVEGFIQGFENGNAIVDVGLKSEGLIDPRELGLDEVSKNLKVGDKIKVYIESFEGRNGRVSISRERVLQEESWNDIKTKFEAEDIIEGEITGRVKGGFIVEIGHVTAFLPGSQVDVRPVKNVSALVGFKQPFKVLKMDELRGNVVVSRRAILEEGHKKAVDKVLANIEEGQIMDGVVKNITNYGAFVDLGTIDGLIHIADISWSRISHPSEVLSLGQQIKVKVIKYDSEKRQVSLGLKQLEHDPWADIAKKLEGGAKLKGKVSNITDYGIFVELDKGVEGLVHVSEMTWSKGASNPIKEYSPGKEVEVVILEVDRDKHRISLSIKRCKENPWKPFADANKVGDVVKAKIKVATDYAFILSFTENIEGVLQYSDLSWSADGKKSAEKYNIGDEIEVKILDLDLEKEKLSSGIKQLEDNPFDNIDKLVGEDKRITVVVSEVKGDGIVVLVADLMPVFIKRADLAKDKGDQRPDRFAVGERIDVKVTKLDSPARKITLSIKALEVADEKKVIEEYGSTSSGASLGDILGDAFDEVVASSNKEDKK
jgi:small subunit ribosomal protein S1